MMRRHLLGSQALGEVSQQAASHRDIALLHLGRKGGGGKGRSGGDEEEGRRGGDEKNR